MHNQVFITKIELPLMLGITSNTKNLRKERNKQ